ncbi:unnamed protein product [Adineta ricciae]|uniref:LsmAD domain-containing protein n=1 Tax=Adineta ricciae TaxID=249248 RepID=A0A814EY73_ADIRI|nr:unnamed protein product [Adineta ricciae]
MSSTRTAPRTTMTNKSTHHTNGSGNSYDMNDSTVTSEFDSNLQRSVLMKNAAQSDGVYRNPRFIHAVTTGLLGQPVVVQTSEPERYHGILETISPNGDIILTVSHRLDNSNNSDIMALSTSLIDLFDAADSSVQSFELLRRTVQAPTIVEIIGIDIDQSGSNKCMLEETSKVSQLEDDRFNRMQHFYDPDEIDSSTLEYLDLGDDGKAGYDPEDMFHTNREKFNTTTDFDESKYTNVPLRPMTVEETAEVEKHAMEIERGNRYEDVDEDDAGVKRPSEYNANHNNDDGNGNPKSNQPSRSHMNERRTDSRYEGEYNTKRGNWRDQRGGGNNRRGGPNNFSMNNPKQNQRSEQTQYTTSRSSEQAPNSRQQPYKSRNNRFNDNRSPHEGRDSPLQAANDETARGQRIHSGSFSQGQNSGPTSPSTTLPTRGVYSANNRSLIGRNSPAPYTGSSSSRNNSTAASSPPPGPSSYQSNQSGGAGNYQQQSNNKMIKKQSRNEQQSTNDDNDQPKPQRNQQPQQQQQNSSNNQSNAVPLSRPSHLHTQQMKQPAQQQQQQQQQQQHQIQPSSSSTNIPPPLSLPNQDEHSSSHETINSNPSDPNMHMVNAPVYTSQTSGSGNAKANSGLNPEAEEFVPIVTGRDDDSRPESRGASSNLPMPPFISHNNSQALHILQQQQQIPQNPTQQPSMIPPTHPQNATALYSPYYSAQYANIAPFVGATPQQMNAGMLGTPMMPPPAAPPQLPGNGPNQNNVGPGGMTTPNSGSGPGYKLNNNPVHGGNTGNGGNTNVGPKKAVVSVQGNEQSNVPQQQQVPQQMIFPGPVRYYQQEYQSQQTTPSSMQIPIFYPISTSGIIPTAGVPPHQNIMISSAGSSGGPTTPGPAPIYYQGVYSGVDPRVYGVYPPQASVGPGSMNSNWPMTRSPPHQQQQQPNEQQRGYGGGQNLVSQAPPPSGAPNPGGGVSVGRSASTSGPPGSNGANGGGPPMTPQYTLSGNVPAYAYGPAAWYSGQASVSSPQTNMAPQVGAYGMVFDPTQQGLPQQTAYVHPNNPYDTAYFQQAPQQPPQQGLDTVPPGSYNR